MKPIVHIPNATLTTPAKPVLRFDKRLHSMITDMKDTLTQAHHPKGVGLAAPQVGEPWKIFLTRPKESDPIRVFINPEIINRSEEMQTKPSKQNHTLEGCLSIPKIWGQVNRTASLTLRYLDEQGATREDIFSGFPAVIIQHEMDHLDGILFTRRVLEQKGKLYQATVDDKGKEVLEEIILKSGLTQP